MEVEVITIEGQAFATIWRQRQPSLHDAHPPQEKARLVRAAALEHTTLKDFVLRNVLRAAHTVIERAERIKLSERDTALLLDLLDNPPAPTARLTAAFKALPSER